MNKITMLLIAVCATLVYSQAQESVDRITSIEVEGLIRTRPFVVKNQLEKFIGMETADFDEKDVIAVVKDLTVVEPVSVELVESENGLVLSVTVKEKWSIIPVPMVLSGKTGTVYGFGVLESNLFGTRDMALVGAVHGPFGWYSTALYNHTPRRNGLPGGTLILLYGSQEREVTNKYEKVQRQYTTKEARVLSGVNYSITDELTASFIFSYADIAIEERNDNLNAPDEGVVRLCFNPSVSWRKRTWDGYFLSSKSISLMYNHYYEIDVGSYHQPEFTLAYEQSLIPGFRLLARSGGVWTSEASPLREDGQMKARVSILPRNFAALSLVGGSAGLEKYLYKAKWGTIAAQATWQGVYYESDVVGYEFNHGPAVGMNFYLARLAVPAMGVSYSYNMDSEIYQVGLTLGMTF